MDSQGAFRPGRISFKNHEHQSTAYVKGQSESWTRAHQCLTTNENPSCSSCCRSLDPQGPIHAMEFLCRSWSPSASNFLQIFSSSNLLFPSHDSCYLGQQEGKLHDDHSLGEQEGKVEVEKTKGYAAQSNTSTFSPRTWFTIERSVPSVLQMPKFFASLLRRRGKTKEEDRLRTANVHATLSVACLAAAIAGFAANSTKEAANDVNPITNGDGVKVAWDNTMGDIVASAAALIATVCAEAAESIGANRAHVASAVNSGLAAQTPADMITLTATAATSLRGAAILKSRTTAYGFFSRRLELLEVGAQLPVVTPSDKIFHVMEETEEGHGNFSISLKSNSGDIKLWFEEENQSLLWISVISNLLQMHKSY